MSDAQQIWPKENLVNVALAELSDQPDTGHRAIVAYNRKGHVTIGWTEAEDEQMEALIQQKMDEGIIFYIVRPFTDQNVPMRQQITKVEDIVGREVSLGDQDFDKFFKQGTIGFMGRIRAGFEILRRTTSAREAARSHTWATRQFVGG